MKFLLTSAGIKNMSIHNTLVDLLGKPIGESRALCIPTAEYGHPQSNPGGAWRFISGQFVGWVALEPTIFYKNEPPWPSWGGGNVRELVYPKMRGVKIKEWWVQKANPP